MSSACVTPYLPSSSCIKCAYQRGSAAHSGHSFCLTSQQPCSFLPSELAFQRIEAQYSLLLSRQIGTPNIASKGKVQSRSVLIPTSLYQNTSSDAKPAGKPLIEELSTPTASSSSVKPSPLKGILKTGSVTSPQTPLQTNSTRPQIPNVPDLDWSRTDDGRLRISLSVPHLVRAFHVSYLISRLWLTDSLGFPPRSRSDHLPDLWNPCPRNFTTARCHLLFGE